MHYFGGKSRLAGPISVYLSGVISEGQSYYEPFCGSLNVATALVADKMYLSDSHHELIQMWLWAFQSKEFPLHVSEDQYRDARDNHLTPAYLKGFIGFGCSFGGKYFGGYARDSRRGGVNFADVANRGITAKVDRLLTNLAHSGGTVSIKCCQYQDVKPESNSVIYCDPPYRGKTGYKGAGEFDYDQFLSVARGWADEGHDVIISGYLSCVPEGATVVWSKSSAQCIRSSDGSQKDTIEVLYTFPKGIQ